MALVAEEIVEEWLNRQGYFTIRGIKLGVHEIDLLAIRPNGSGLERRHIEVQVSYRPISYISRVPKDVQARERRAATSARARAPDELAVGVREWINKKFDHPEKKRIRDRLASGAWTRELVVHKVKHEAEIPIMESHGITITRFEEVLRDLAGGRHPVSAAAGGSLVDLLAQL